MLKVEAVFKEVIKRQAIMNIDSEIKKPGQKF